MNRYVLLSNKPWHAELIEELNERFPQDEWILIQKKILFTKEKLNEIQPKKIFIPHWSNIISSDIYNEFECVVFHMTDLPYGRGGSPLQNLIIRGHKKTKVSALLVNEEIDGGPIYLKKPLLLEGTALQIFIRSSRVIKSMIIEIIENNLIPKRQTGTPVVFKRRKPHESNIEDLQTLGEVFNYIRMLDCEGYPNAFIETKHFKFQFTNAIIKENKSIKANVEIIKK